MGGREGSVGGGGIGLSVNAGGVGLIGHAKLLFAHGGAGKAFGAAVSITTGFQAGHRFYIGVKSDFCAS